MGEKMEGSLQASVKGSALQTCLCMLRWTAFMYSPMWMPISTEKPEESQSGSTKARLPTIFTQTIPSPQSK